MNYSILHITIALNLFIASLGLHVHEHICKKQGTTISFYFKLPNCCSGKKSRCKSPSITDLTSDFRNQTTISKIPCCQDKLHYDKCHFKGLAVKLKQSKQPTETFDLFHKKLFYAFAESTYFDYKDAFHFKILALFKICIYKLIMTFRC